MKKLGFVLLLVVALASPAMAGQVQVGYSGSAYGLYEANPGGEFTLNPLNGSLDVSHYGAAARDVGLTGTFQTFCIEENEYIYPYDTTYTVNLNTAAVFGGVGGGVVGGDPLNLSGTGDPVSRGTGWLYSQFAQGTLPGYGYEADRLDSAAALQQAIWYLEDEIPTTYVSGTNVYVDAAITHFGTLDAAKGGTAADFGVYALNLWTGDPYASTGAQDQLFYHVPDGGTTLMLLGGALMGIGALRRKFRA